LPLGVAELLGIQVETSTNVVRTTRNAEHSDRMFMTLT
jgi:hypothetical protein